MRVLRYHWKVVYNDCNVLGLAIAIRLAIALAIVRLGRLSLWWHALRILSLRRVKRVRCHYLRCHHMRWQSLRRHSILRHLVGIIMATVASTSLDLGIILVLNWITVSWLLMLLLHGIND